MRYFVAMAVLIVGLMFAIFASPSNAATTYADGTAGVGNSGQPYTPVAQTSTTDTEAAPTGATAGYALTASQIKNRLNAVVTVKAHIVVNSAGDAGIYDPGDTGAGGPGLNTFSSGAKLRMWVLDDANGNTVWTRYPTGDVTLAAGDTTATTFVKVGELPQIKRFALLPYKTNVPVKVTYSDR